MGAAGGRSGGGGGGGGGGEAGEKEKMHQQKEEEEKQRQPEEKEKGQQTTRKNLEFGRQNMKRQLGDTFCLSHDGQSGHIWHARVNGRLRLLEEGEEDEQYRRRVRKRKKLWLEGHQQRQASRQSMQSQQGFRMAPWRGGCCCFHVCVVVRDACVQAYNIGLVEIT